MTRVHAGCYQFNVQPGDLDGNIAAVEKALPEFARRGCRLLVLPEMWSCSFVYPRLKAMAENTPSIVERLQGWSRLYEMVIVGSLPESVKDAIFNCSYVIDAGGEVVGKYRKIHLFSMYGEHFHFARGKKPLVCSTQVGRLGILICYDLRFPELARRLALDGAEILCASALWPKTRIEHWSLLLRSRAIENQLFVVGCNGCGMEGKMQYGGASVVVSPTGDLVAQASDGEERLMAELDLAEIASFRRHITCFPDRVPGAYGIE